MRNQPIFILASFERVSYLSRESDILGQEQLVKTLPTVTKDNEFSFDGESDLSHLCASRNSLTSWWVENEMSSVISKEQRLWKKTRRETLVLIPLNLDGFMFSDEWQSGWKNQIASRLAPDFTGWNIDFADYGGRYHRKGIRSIIDALIVDDTKEDSPFE